MAFEFDPTTARPEGEAAPQFDPTTATPAKEATLGERVSFGARRMVNSARTTLTDDPNKIAQIAADQAKAAPAQSAASRQMQEEIKPYADAANNATGVVDTVKTWGALGAKRAGQLISNPGETVKMIAEQLPNSVPGLAGAVAGAKAGAMAGTAVAPGVGTAIGAVGGGVLGGLAGGYLTEKGASVQEQVQTKAAERGIDLQDQQAVAGVFRSNQAEIDKAATLKAVGTAGTDAVLNVLTAGLSGMGRRILGNEVATMAEAVKAGRVSTAEAVKQLGALEARAVAQSALPATLARGAAVTGAEMLGEGVSEAVGQKLAYGKVDAGDVVDESLLGLGQGVAMAGASSAVNRIAGTPDRDQIQQNIASLRERLLAGQDAAPAQGAAADPLMLPNTQPDRLYVFPDGTVGRTGEVESYLANLPDDQQAEARARFMGQAYTEVNDPQRQQARRWWENYGQGQDRQPSPDYVAEVQAAVRSGTPFTTQQTVDTVRSAMEDAWLAQNVSTEAPGAAETADAVGEQLQGEFEQAGGDAAVAAVDARVRTSRVLGGLQNILDAGAENSLQALSRLNTSLTRIGEQPLTGEEASRVRRIVDAYMGFRGVGEPAPLPALAPPAVDPFADNTAMEALIPERPSRAMGLDSSAGALSAAAVTAVDGGLSQALAQRRAQAQAQQLADQQAKAGGARQAQPQGSVTGATGAGLLANQNTSMDSGNPLRDAIQRIRSEKARANPQAQALQTQTAQADAAGNQASAPVGSDGAAQPGAAPAGNAGVEAARVEPGSEAGNGFKRGPQAGERYRVSVVDAAGGAVSLEKRLPAGTPATFYVGRDGGLVDGDTVDLSRPESRNRLWIPANDQQVSEAKQILDGMGQLALNDPKRAELKAQLKRLVSGVPAQSPTTTEPTNGTQATQTVETAPQGREETALLSDSVSTEPNLEAAKALLVRQRAATGNAVAEGKLRKELRDLAAKTPETDTKTVLALDTAATRLGMGEGKLKGLEFMPAESSRLKRDLSEPAPAAAPAVAAPATSQQAQAPATAPAVQPTVDQAANEAATSPSNDLPEPTQAQKEAGNYKKAHLKFDGLDLTVENPVGSTRSGVDPNGRPWQVTMTAHYGYHKRTKGADGDQVDVYLANDPKPGSPVFVFDQFNADGTFDEHKAVAGVGTQAEAEAIYDAHFSDGSGPRRRRGITAMPVAEFKTWAASDEAAKGPAAGVATAGALQSAPAPEGQTNDQAAATTAPTPDSTQSSRVRDAGTPADGEAAQTDGAQRAVAPQPEQAEKKSGRQMAPGLHVGSTPGTAERVTVRDGVVFIGRYEALNYDTAEPVTVAPGSSRAKVAKALQDAGVLTSGQKLFGLSQPDEAVGAAARGEGGPRIDAEMVRRILTPAPAMSVEEARVAVMGMAKDWRNGPTVRVVAKPGDLPGNRAPDTRGLYLNGVAYIVAGRHHSSRALLATLAHEVIAHHGLRTMLGAIEWQRAMRNIQQGLERGDAALLEIREQIRGAYRDEAGNFNLSPAQEADEIAARAVELGFDAGAGEFRTEYAWVKRAYSRIAQFLRNLGFDVSFTNAELQGMLARAQRFLVNPAKGNGFVVGDEQVAGAMARDVPSELDMAVIGHDLGTANNHPRYAAAKAGDVDAAVDVAKSLVTPEFVAKVRTAIGDAQPVVVPVVAEEATGRNKIPLAAAVALSKALGTTYSNDILQANTPRRTGLDGLGRIFAPVEFDGQVVPGQTYLLLDDTLTQGGTFKSLANFIEAGGGRVVGAVALTGKQYSAKIGLTPSTLQTLREKHGASESDFQAATGYGFDALTESEARYLANFKPADAVRTRIAEAGRQGRQQADRGTAGPVDSGGAAARGPSPVEAKASTEAGAPRQWETSASERFDNVVYKLQDRLIDTKRVQEAIRATSGQIGDDLNVYLQEELFHGRAASRVKAFADRELLPLFNQMRAAGLEISDVEEFLHARHAREANALIAERDQSMRDGGSGMTNAAADAYMQALSAGQRRKLEAAAAKVDAIIASTRQLYADYGLEDQSTVDGWGQMFKSYVPLMREDKDGSMGVGQGFSIKGKEVKGRTGSTRKVVDILANVAAQRERVIVRGEKNRVARALVGLAQVNPNPQFWEVRSQPPTERVYDAARDMVVERPDSMFKQRPNVITAKVRDSRGNVTEQAVVLNEDNPRAVRMAQALKNLDAGNLEGLLGASATITRYFAAINTQYNPVFGVVNLVRDVQAAMVNLAATPLAGQQRRIATDTAAALAAIYRDVRAARRGGRATSAWSTLWEQMQADGGTTGYRDLFRTSADRAEQMQSILTPEGWMKTGWGRLITADGRLKVPAAIVQKQAGMLFDWLSDYNEAMENGVRLATYKAALDNGMSREQAASLSKNLTVNFNRRGQVGLQAGALYAFFNAAMQGTARIGQTIFDMDNGNPKTLRLSSVGKKVVYGGALLGSIQALMLAAAGFDDDDPPEFVRERALIIPTGGKTYISIPMPLGLHVIPGLGRHATEFALSGFDKPAHRVLALVAMFADAFNPIGNAGLSIQTLAPTALDPLVALSENRDWTGKPIARVSSNKALPGHAQWKDTATTWSKLIAEGINYVSGGNEYVAGVLSPTPDQIDYLIAQLTGGVGRELSKVEQSARSLITGEELPTYKVPLIGRLVGNADSQASQGNAFYANLNRINEVETEIKGLRKDGRSVDAARLMRERPEARLIQMANRTERRVQELRREKRALVEKGADKEVVRAKDAQVTAEMTRLNLAVERARETAR